MRHLEDEIEIGLSWFDTGKEFIHQQLVTAQDRKKHIPNDYGFYSPAQRALSEMAICEALLGLTLPSIFETQEFGKATFPFRSGRFECGHIYGLTNSGVCLCITFGQFIDIDMQNPSPGSRIRTMQKILPENIRFDPSLGTAVLVAHFSTIREKIGLEYN